MQLAEGGREEENENSRGDWLSEGGKEGENRNGKEG